MFKRNSVAVFARNNSFLDPVLEELNRRDCLVKRAIISDSESFDLVQTYALLKESDCAFFDFAHNPLPMATWLPVNCRITVRIHGLEIYDSLMKTINWSHVNVVCSAPQTLRFVEEVKTTPQSLHTINLGVPVPAKPKEIFGHNIGLIAFTPLPRKRIYTTIESFCDLLLQSPPNRPPEYHTKETDWRLHIRSGELTGYRNSEAAEYLKFISELQTTMQRLKLDSSKIEFHRHMDDKTYQRFLRSLDIVLSNSMQEGYHVAALEAMNQGAYPLIHRWLGASLVFPEDSLFLTQRQLVDKILEWDRLTLEQKKIKSLQVQKFVRENHSQEECMKKLVDVILGVA